MSWGAIAGAAVGVVGSAITADSGGGGGQGGILNPYQEAGANQLLAAISQYMKGPLAQSSQEYGKQAAIADSRGLVSSIFREYQNEALPQIMQMEAGSGGYNSSTGQLLANDAFAGAVSKSQAAVLDTINKYRAIEQNDFATLAKLVGSIPGGTPDTSTNSTLPWNLIGDAVGAGVAEINKPRPKPKPNPVNHPDDYGVYF